MNKYYAENQGQYINGFAMFMKERIDEEYTTDEVKRLFKDYMLDYKNIKIDFRNKFWLITMQKSMKQAGFKLNGGKL